MYTGGDVSRRCADSRRAARSAEGGGGQQGPFVVLALPGCARGVRPQRARAARMEVLLATHGGHAARLPRFSRGLHRACPRRGGTANLGRGGLLHTRARGMYIACCGAHLGRDECGRQNSPCGIQIGVEASDREQHIHARVRRFHRLRASRRKGDAGACNSAPRVRRASCDGDDRDQL